MHEKPNTKNSSRGELIAMRSQKGGYSEIDSVYKIIRPSFCK